MAPESLTIYASVKLLLLAKYPRFRRYLEQINDVVLDLVETKRDDEIARGQERLLDRPVGEHAAKPRVRVGDDALRFVGDHGRDAVSIAQSADGRCMIVVPYAKARDDNRLLRRA